MNNISVNRIQAEIKKHLKSPTPNVLVRPSPDNIYEWHFCFHHLAQPYKNAFVHGVLYLPADYPFSPPQIIFLTPNGRFSINTKICTSFSSYHKESWTSSWTIEKMLLGLLSFFLQQTNTLGSQNKSHQERARLANNSLKFNLKNQTFLKVFKQAHEELGLERLELPHQPQPVEHQQQPDQQPVRSRLATYLCNGAKLLAVIALIYLLK